MSWGDRVSQQLCTYMYIYTYSSDTSPTLQGLVLPSNSRGSAHEGLHLNESGVGVSRHVVGQHASKGQQRSSQGPQLSSPLGGERRGRVYSSTGALWHGSLPPPSPRPASQQRQGWTHCREEMVNQWAWQWVWSTSAACAVCRGCSWWPAGCQAGSGGPGGGAAQWLRVDVSQCRCEGVKV